MTRTGLLKPVAALAFSLAILIAFQGTAAAAEYGVVNRASGGSASTAIVNWGFNGIAIRPSVCQDTNEGPQSISATVRLWQRPGGTWALRLKEYQTVNTMDLGSMIGPCFTFKFGGESGYRDNGQTPYYVQVEYAWYFPTGWQRVTKDIGWVNF